MSNGTRILPKPTTRVPGGAALRPLRDGIVVEPLGAAVSKQLIVIEKMLPLRGIVKAVGPGHYPKRYDHPDKHRRTKMWDSDVFQPTTVKVGDVVELGGLDYGGYSFETFWWGDVLHIKCREQDVSGVRDDLDAEQARAEAERATA